MGTTVVLGCPQATARVPAVGGPRGVVDPGHLVGEEREKKPLTVFGRCATRDALRVDKIVLVSSVKPSTQQSF